MNPIAEQLRGTAIERETQLYFLEKGLAETRPTATTRGKALADRIQNNPALIREVWAKTDGDFFTELELRCVRYAQMRERERCGDASNGKSGARAALPQEARCSVPRSSQTIPAGAAQGEAVRDREGVGQMRIADGQARGAHPSRDTNADGAGQKVYASQASAPVPAPSSPELNGGGHGSVASDGQSGCAPSREAEAAPPLGHNKPPRFTPGHARRGASAIAAVQHVATKTLLDTFKVRDGRVIGDLLFKELEGLRAANAKEAAVLRAVQHHTANAAPMHRVRDIVSPDTFAAIVARAEEEAHAA
jgi:hypothetical protein